MIREEFDAIVAALRPFVTDAPASNGGKSATPAEKKTAELHSSIDAMQRRNAKPPAEPFTDKRTAPFDEEAMYQRFRARMIDDAKLDPILLHLLINQPEIIVEYEKTVETIEGSTLRGRVARLIARGFMDEPKTTGNVRTELTRTGPEPNSGGLSTTLAALVGLGFLTRAGEGWVKAPGVKVTEKAIESS
jgi:hypothetical protein